MSEIRVNTFKAEDGISAPSFPNGIQVTGVVTTTSLASNVPQLNVGSNIQLGNAGIVTASTFKGNGDFVELDVDGHTNLDNVNIAGVATFASAVNTGALTASTGTFSGNVSVGGTLTYEDVTNIDSVGIVTAREGVFVPDTKEIKIGNTAGTPDLKIFHDGNNKIQASNGYVLLGSTNNNIYLDGNNIQLRSASGAEKKAKFVDNGTAELYYNNSKVFNTEAGGVLITGVCSATSYTGDGSALTGIDSASITTGTTKVQTAATSIVNQVSGAGIATITAQGLNVTGIVTATSMTVFSSGIDYQWQGGTATAWWKSEDLVSETSWPAAKGGTDANFVNGAGGSNGISYIASDSLFNNHKSVSMSSGGAGSLRTSNEDQNRWWTNSSTAFTMIMALQKDGHHSGTSLGDSAFAINYNSVSANSNVGGWGFCPFGDHTWGGQYGEMFGYTGSLFEDNFMQFSYPFRGLFMIRMGANFDYGELSVNGGHGWHALEMRHSGPSSFPSNNFRSISILNNSSENSSSHNFEGRVAECAWYNGKRLGGSELDAITKHWCNKFNL